MYKQGFTLIELLVVITIIGILSIGGFTQTQSYLAKARDSQRQKNISEYVGALNAYQLDNIYFPFKAEDLVTLKDNKIVYTAVAHKDGQEKRLFARYINRPPPCDLCHDVHFIYVFEGNGKITQFIPVQLTKYGNKSWSEEDVLKMRELILGHHVDDLFDFDPDVDAVTSATITSAVIFNSMDEGQEIYNELKAKGLI